MRRLASGCVLGLLAVSCATGPDTGSIGDLQTDIVIRSHRPAAGATPALRVKDRAVVHYSRFVRLFEALPDEAMRRDGMRRLAQLQQQVDADPGMAKGSVPVAAVVELFESLMQAYPQQRNDRLLYQLSREYDESGQQQAALASLDRLVSRYPDSMYYVESQFRRGEILFVQRDYARAEVAYGAVVEVGSQSRLYEQAIYKQGWSRFKQSHYPQALDAFMQILDRHIKNEFFEIAALDRAEGEFIEDVFRAISLSFSYQAGPLSADEYLSKRERRVYEHLLFQQLSEFYLQKKHYADAVKASQTFVARNPNSVRSPEFLLRVIAIYKQGGFPNLLIAAKKDFVQRYGMKADFWSSHGGVRLQPVVDALRQNLMELAGHYHSQAQTSHARIDYREAQRWYRTFLSSFPDDAQAARMNFLFAEILFEDKQYEDAVLQYEKTAYDYRDFPQSADAGYAALLTYERQEQSLDGVHRQHWHRRAIDSALRFAERFPGHAQTGHVLAGAAEKLYQLGEYELGYTVASQVIQHTDNSELKQSAWLVLAHTEFVWEAYDKAEISYNHALKTMPADHPQRQAVMEKQAVAVYRQGELSRAQGDLKQAVKQFSRVKQFNPGSGIVASAEYDQAAALIALRDWASAALVLEGFRASHASHQLQPEVTRKLALVYMEKGDDKKAAAEYEKISRLPADAALQLEALWQAAELYEQASATEPARKMYKQFIKRFPRPLERAVEARQRLVELYSRDRDDRALAFWQRDIIRADAGGGAQRTERSRYLAAKACFALAEPGFENYRKVQLKVPLKKSLARKKKSMDAALRAYGECAAYKVAEVLTAATYRIAEIYQHLGLAIFNSERPKTLSGEELEQYDVLLEEQAYPFEEKAIEFHEINVARISEGFHGVWVMKSFEDLKQLLPVRYAKQERNESVVDEIF
jgi:tetratricopeptide (TPR) repeat protein